MWYARCFFFCLNGIKSWNMTMHLLCTGAVTKLRLLGDSQHMSRIAFVEFGEAESANRALDISGALLGAHCSVARLHSWNEMPWLTSGTMLCFARTMCLNHRYKVADRLSPAGMLPLRISPSKTPVRSSPTDIQSDRSRQRPWGSLYRPLNSSRALVDKSSAGND